MAINQILMFRMFKNLLTKLLKKREVHYFQLIQTNAIVILFMVL